ncbi:RND transporter family protein [Desulfogranum mediterraneum]|uniref:hypothetical protein n=1 Tax=Desulfogranum mediterraneum TaxID=160661 RepID=UPI000426F088|nr:hypothetical protein [Desulfogranum mediterraneum]
MKTTDSPLLRPKAILGLTTLASLLCTLLFCLTAEQGINRYLSRGFPWQPQEQRGRPQAPQNQEWMVAALVNNSDPQGIFSSASLRRMSQISGQVPAGGRAEGEEEFPVDEDFLGPETRTPQGDDLGSVQAAAFMAEVPDTPEAGQQLHQQGLKKPLLNSTLVAVDGKAMALRLPLRLPGRTAWIRRQLEEAPPAAEKDRDRLHFGGFTLAWESFFREMQWRPLLLAGCSTMAMLLAGLLFLPAPRCCWLPLVPALSAGMVMLPLLSISGFPAGSFSLLIPWLSGATALLYSLAALTTYQGAAGAGQELPARIALLRSALLPRLRPLSLALTAGFLVMLCSPLPEIRFFGGFSAVAVLAAWAASTLLLPPLLSILPPAWLAAPPLCSTLSPPSWLRLGWSPAPLLVRISALHRSFPKLVVAGHLLLLLLSLVGLSLLSINDNPLHRFSQDHSLRRDQAVINQHLAGPYQLRLELRGAAPAPGADEAGRWLERRFQTLLSADPWIRRTATADIREYLADAVTSTELSTALDRRWQRRIAELSLDQDLAIDLWSRALESLSQFLDHQQLFLRPELLAWIQELQDFVVKESSADKGLSVCEIVKSTHQALFEGDPGRYRLPETSAGVRQLLAAYGQSQPPDALGRYLNQEATRATIYWYLPSADKAQRRELIREATTFMTANHPPLSLELRWRGALHEHGLWQERLLGQMLLWTGAALLIGCTILALISRCWLCGLISAGLFLSSSLLCYGLLPLPGQGLSTLETTLLALILIMSSAGIWLFFAALRADAENHGHWQHPEQESRGQEQIFLLRFALLLGAGSVPLYFSSHPPLQRLGIMVSGLVAIFCLTFRAMMPIVLNWLGNTIFQPELSRIADKASPTADSPPQTPSKEEQEETTSVDQSDGEAAVSEGSESTEPADLLTESSQRPE